jgi:hypothetical protein
MSLQQFKNFKEVVVKKEFPGIKIPETKAPNLNLDKLNLKILELKNFISPPLLTPEQLKENYKTFVSPNKTFKIKYPANWQETDKSLLEKISQEYKLKESEILFLAYQKKIVEFPPLLIIQRLLLEKESEEVIEEVKRIAEKQQAEFTIIKKETKNKIDYFEAKYKKKNYTFYLNGGIISDKERNYLIIVLTLDQLQKEITPQINFIFESIQIIHQ